MKKSNRVLSFVLSLLVAFASMPIVYTTALDADVYASGKEGTIENPTVSVSESGEYRQDEVNHLTAIHKSLNFTFYQTMDNQYFRLAQLVQMEKYCGSTASITVNINGYNFNGNDAKTVSFFNEHAGEFLWTAGTTDSGNTNFPNSFEATGSIIGCTDYSWSLDVIFKGMTANESGEANIGYSHLLDYTVTVDGAVSNYQTPIATNIKILDARQLVAEMEKAENIVANPSDYTDEYVSANEAALKSVPENLKDFSVVYTQSQIDGYVAMFRNISKNSADYTEYNTVYSNLSNITNSKGAFTDDSFVAFKAEISRINNALPKNLDYTRQAEVDAATQALRNAYSMLVSTDLSESNTGASYTTNGDDGDMSFTIDNTAFKFMQIKDSQVFEYSQMWTIRRNGGNTDRNFGGMILQRADLSNACDNSTCRLNQVPATNNTAAFVSRLTSDSYATITAENEVGTSITAPEFLCWNEYTDATATTLKDTTIVDTEGSYVGALDSDRSYAYSNNQTYYLQNSPKFTGNPAGTYGSISTNYVLRTGWNYKTGGFLGIGATKKSSHIHVNTTIEVTDVRQLISAVTQANQVISNPANHSEAYIVALQAAVASVPVEVLRGVEYYTQAEVDKLYLDITTIPEQVADYAEFVEVFEMMMALNPNKYTDESYKEFSDTIYAINQNLPKNLTVDQQATIDAAIDALYDAYDKLVSKHLNDDNVITQDDVNGGALGNNPLEFSIATTQYNFMLTEDGQKFDLGIELRARKNRTDYNAYIRELGFSNTIPGAPATYCSSDDFCHHLDQIDPIVKEHTPAVVGEVTGVTPMTFDANGAVVANGAGVVSEYTTWENISGPALTSGGYLTDNVGVSTTESVAHADMYYVGATGNQEAKSGYVDATYALWFGWYYVQPFFGNEGPADELYRHVHIPVNVKITDARALNTLYTEIEDILNGDTDKTYTLSSLVTLYNAFNKVPTEMVEGEKYYTQEQVDEMYASLKVAHESATEGADYSEFFDAYVKGQEIVNSNNKDSAGNSLYDDSAYESFTQQFTDIVTGLDMNLPAEEQGVVDQATTELNNAIANLEETKHADYSEFNEVFKEIVEISKEEMENPGTFTKDSLDEILSVYEQAEALDKELPASEQATVDAVTSALEAALADMMYKADYSEFDNAYSQVQDIVNNPDNYSGATVEAAQKALEEADKLDKELEDTAANRVTIQEATDKLNDVLNNVEGRADYSEFDSVVDSLKDIVNNPDNYTNETVEAAKDALQNAEDFDKGLPESQQGVVDSFVNDLKDVLNSAEKKADYTDYNNAKSEADSLVNDDGNGNPIYDEDAFNAYKEAVNNVDNALEKDLPESEQSKVDDATKALEDAKTELENNKYADYTDFDAAKDALEEIVNAPAGTYTEETVKNAQEALDNANQIPDNLVVGENNVNQDMINNATQNMQDVIDSAEKKADYTEFDKAVEDLENIVNAPEGTYTEETVKNAQDALDSIVDTDKDMADTEQDILDEITAGLKEVVDSAEKKADYSEFDSVVDSLEEIVNNPDNYTSETVEAAKDALQNAEDFDKDLPESQQGVVDSFVNDLKDVLNSADKKADYTDYNNAKSEADSLVNDDGNGNPVYDEDAFNAYKETVNNVDNALEKDLPESEQSKVDEAVNALDNALNTLESSRYYTVTFLDAEGNVLASERFVSGAAFGTIVAPALPESTDEIAVCGWAYESDVLAGADDVLTSDVAVKVAAEDKVLRIFNESGFAFDTSTGYIVTESRSLTVADVLTKFDNDASVLVIKDFNGNVLSADDYVGSGATVTLESKYCDGVTYESRTFVVYGDVNGDGLVDSADYSKSRLVNIGAASYSEQEHCFFVANDVYADGYIDALDTSYINLMVKGYK